MFILVYPNWNNDSKRFFAKKYHLPKGITRKYTVTISENFFYDQEFNSDIKRYEEIRKLTTGRGGAYSTACLLDYEYIKNY